MQTKQDLIAFLGSGSAESAYPSKAEAERAVNNVVDALKSLLSRPDCEGLNLVGFGVFRKVTRAARIGKNPQTGESLQIPESKSVAFRLSKGFKETLN